VPLTVAVTPRSDVSTSVAEPLDTTPSALMASPAAPSDVTESLMTAS
jgi:hypothetical protein